MPLSAIRSGQIITTYGIGSLVPLEDGGSVIIAGLDYWDGKKNRPDSEIDVPRLANICGVETFYKPPTGNSSKKDIPVFRFPTMVYCSGCEALKRHKDFCPPDENQHKNCQNNEYPPGGAPKLNPSRFVVACQDGHLDDFPYSDWVHNNDMPSSGKHALTLTSSGHTASLASMVITCINCDRSRNMGEAMTPHILDSLFRCKGRQPWLDMGDDNLAYCGKSVAVLLRGASNVWFPVPESALSIPPTSTGIFKVIEKYWPVLKAESVSEEALPGILDSMKGPYPLDALVEEVKRRRKGNSDSESTVNSQETRTKIRRDEYLAITGGRDPDGRNEDFVSKKAEMNALVAKWFDKVMEVEKLTEIRTLKSFTRVFDPGTPDPNKPKLARLSKRDNHKWLPAIEVRGEGVFLSIDSKQLTDWEKLPSVIQRTNRITSKGKGIDSIKNLYGPFENADPNVIKSWMPRFILCHTLAHVLINQWAIDAGYPASSLRERLYVGDNMAGILIYTAQGDSAGSLGGVLAQAKPDTLLESLQQSLNKACWCSNDPLCIESLTGSESLNLGACHACALLQEVSCEMKNSYLDRGLLIKTYNSEETGFFPLDWRS